MISPVVTDDILVVSHKVEETVSFDVYKDNANCDFLTSLLVQHGTGLEFNYLKDDIGTYMQPGEVFQAGTAYTAMVWLRISQDNTFFDL